MLRSISGIVVVLLGIPAFAEEAKKKPIEVDDLYQVESIMNMALAPSGKNAVFERTWIDPDTKLERHTLWLVPGKASEAQPLEMSLADSRRPVYSPDGKWIAFLSTRPRPLGWKQILPVPPESDVAADIWLAPADGSGPLALSGPDKTYGRVLTDNFYARLAFSPDGKKLVFVADDGVDPRTPAELINDVTIVRADQGEGYTGFRPAQIWIAHLDLAPVKTDEAPKKKKGRRFAASKIERLTKDDVWYGDPQWSPDGKTIFVHANKTKDRESVRHSINRDFDIFAIDVADRSQQQLTFGPGPDVCPRLSPDGKKLAFLTVPRKGSHRDYFNLAVLTLGEKTPVTLFDHHNPKLDKPLHPSPSFPLPEDCWDGDSITFQAQVKTGNVTVRVSSVDGKQQAQLSQASQDRRKKLNELEPPANAWLEDRIIPESTVVTWKNDLGQDIEGVFTPPATGKAPFKLLLFPHGGPHSRSSLGFEFAVQAFAGAGYAVLEPNFRGSYGYGQKFIDADRKDFGGGDMRDILAGVDHLIKTKQIDPTRQFVFGSSYGGYLTTWLVGQTNQFKAAAAQNPVTDLHMMWHLTDIPSWVHWEFDGYPWQISDVLRKASPLTHAHKVKTPTLLIHSVNDRRCPLPMGLAYHRALQTRDVPTQMVLYPGEGHGIRQPRHREDVLRRVLAWFAKHDNKR